MAITWDDRYDTVEGNTTRWLMDETKALRARVKELENEIECLRYANSGNARIATGAGKCIQTSDCGNAGLAGDRESGNVPPTRSSGMSGF